MKTGAKRVEKPAILQQMEKGLAAVVANGGKVRRFLCIADGERFTIEAANLKQAQEDASIYCGSVIEEIK